MKVYISAATNLEFLHAREIVANLGHDVLSSWLILSDNAPRGAGPCYREHNRNKLSCEALTELADDSLDELVRADVLVSIFDRDAPPDLRGSSGWVGFALARGIPVIAVGVSNDTIVSARRVQQVDWDSLGRTLTRIGNAFKMYRESQQKERNLGLLTTSTVQTNATDSSPGPSGPVRVENPAAGASSGTDPANTPSA